MIRFRCDKCGRPLEPNATDRYIVSIEAYAAAGPLEFTEDEIARDHTAEINAVLDQLRHADPDTIEDQVYRRLRFDLCADCHRQFLDNPLDR